VRAYVRAVLVPRAPHLLKHADEYRRGLTSIWKQLDVSAPFYGNMIAHREIVSLPPASEASLTVLLCAVRRGKHSRETTSL
jgi:hypothetical protein